MVLLDINHSMSVTDVVGSGRPFIDADGNLRLRSTYATTELSDDGASDGANRAIALQLWLKAILL